MVGMGVPSGRFSFDSVVTAVIPKGFVDVVADHSVILLVVINVIAIIVAAVVSVRDSHD